MITTCITFGPLDDRKREAIEDIAEGYLVSLLRSGQICDHYFLSWFEGSLQAHVRLAGKEANQMGYHSQSGLGHLQKVESTFGRKPQWQFLDDGVDRPLPDWRGAPFLYLFTHAFDYASPVCRADGKPVPVFSLPVSFPVKDHLYCWQGCYRHLDNVWLESSTLEIPAYRELANPSSPLSRTGRELCREVESATGMPV